MNQFLQIWLEELEAEDPMEGPSAEYISPITHKLRLDIATAVVKGAYGDLENLLGVINPTVMRCDVMVALLRTLYPIKSKLANYSYAVIRVREELDLRGKDSERILRGLIEGTINEKI